MKKQLLILFLSACISVTMAQAAGLPVLRVKFDGEIVRDMSYVNGKMQLTDTDGKVIEMPAKFRTRGATAQEYLMKPSLNMKLRTADYSEEQDSALLGMRSCSSWILDAMAIDRICMRNRVAFDIWNEYARLPYETDFNGRNGTEGRFIELYINDQYYGIYCLSDRINRKLLNLKKVKEQEDGTVLIRGVLYKSGTMNMLNQNEPAYSDDSVTCVVEWHDAWELKYPEEYAGRVAWQPLQDAILQGTSTEYVKKYFYLENLADYQLHVMALGIADNWGKKNRFFSIRNINKDINDSDPTESDRRRIVVTPWDLDTSLGGAYNGEYYGGNYTDWPVRDIPKNSPYPFSSLHDDAEYGSVLKERWLKTRTRAFSPKNVKAKLEAYRDLFINSGAWQRMVDYFETQKERPCYVKDLTKEIQSIMVWYEARFQEMDAFFGVTDGITAPSTPSDSPSATTFDLLGRPSSPGQFTIRVQNSKKLLIK